MVMLILAITTSSALDFAVYTALTDSYAVASASASDERLSRPLLPESYIYAVPMPGLRLCLSLLHPRDKILRELSSIFGRCQSPHIVARIATKEVLQVLQEHVTCLHPDSLLHTCNLGHNLLGLSVCSRLEVGVS